MAALLLLPVFRGFSQEVKPEKPSAVVTGTKETLSPVPAPSVEVKTEVKAGIKSDVPPENEIWERAVKQVSEGEWKHLKGAAEVRTSEMTISADEIDFNEDTAWTYARGHVHLEHFASKDVLNADHGEYNLKTEEGKFYAVSGTSPAKVMTGPGALTTTNPFYFQAQWADRIKNRYVLHHGFVTDCKVPKPWWTFNAPVFDIVPGQRAIARQAIFRVKRVPILYLPYFFRPLGRNTRQSGFLPPNLGHSTTRGYIYGLGYYWAINRSYDLDYIFQYYSARGPANAVNFRGKPNSVSDFNFSFFSVNDQGDPVSKLKEGGATFTLSGRTEFLGFTARLDYTYLSSMLFRAAFTNVYSAQLSSVGYLQRHFKNNTYTLNIVFRREQNFLDYTNKSQQVVLQKLPMAEVSSRDQNLLKGRVPLYFSLEASGGLLSRDEQSVETGYLMSRTNLQPKLRSAFNFLGFSLSPSVTFGATDYSNYYQTNATSYTPNSNCGGYPSCPPTPTSNVALASANLFRKDVDFTIDFRLPSIVKIYTPPAWLHLGAKIKHVLEADARYEYVTGLSQYDKIIRFDELDVLTNTNQLTIAVTNRLYTKDKKGNVREFLTWRIQQARYFDPTFGGAVQPGMRSVIAVQEELTPYTFLDGPRTYSPVISSLVVNPYNFLRLEYRAAYDPKRQKFLDHTIDGGVHYKKYSVNLNETAITTNPLLVPQTNQLGFGGGYGTTTSKGLNAGASIYYDLLLKRQTFSLFQLAYNTDCCGFGFQLRRINNFIRNDNQYLFSFSVANLGSFGSLQKQNRIF